MLVRELGFENRVIIAKVYVTYTSTFEMHCFQQFIAIIWEMYKDANKL